MQDILPADLRERVAPPENHVGFAPHDHRHHFLPEPPYDPVGRAMTPQQMVERIRNSVYPSGAAYEQEQEQHRHYDQVLSGEFPHSKPGPLPYEPSGHSWNGSHPAMAPTQAVVPVLPEQRLPNRSQPPGLILNGPSPDMLAQTQPQRKSASGDRLCRLIGFIAGKLGPQQWKQVVDEFNVIELSAF